MVWITTDNVSVEAWNALYEFTNIEMTMDVINLKYPSLSKNDKTNCKKQAEQIRFSILQAKEYFEAAASSSLITSPNHLYYGMVSLCSSIMLLLGNGEKSLDFLRKTPANMHHGLTFSTNANASNSRKGLEILNNSHVKVEKNGFFQNWYSTMPIYSQSYGIVKKHEQHGALVNREVVGIDTHKKLSEILGFSSSLIDLLKTFPDLKTSLQKLGVPITASRVDLEIRDNLVTNQRQFEWRIHEAPSTEDLDSILENFRVIETDSLKLEKIISSNKLSALVKLSCDMQAQFSFPSFRETINNEKIMFSQNQFNYHELVDAFLVVFALSMLSRYYPDLWVNCLESKCKAATLIEKVVSTLSKKVPLMALSVMHGNDYVISTHRPDWHF
jgi:YaaC-like Protein